MSIWSDMQDRSAGISVRNEDIRRANWTIRITSTESFASYDRIRLTPDQKKSFDGTAFIWNCGMIGSSSMYGGAVESSPGLETQERK